MPRHYDEDDDEDLGPSRPDFQFDFGTKGIVSLFGAVAVLCGLFWAFGYTVGKHSVPASFSLGDTAAAQQAAGSATKPAAGTPIAQSQAPAAVPPNPSDLTAAEVNQTPQTLVPGPNGETPAATPVTGNSAAGATTAAAGGQTAAPAISRSSMQPASLSTAPVVHSYAVQVFAGAKQGDALSLAAALKARQYPVFVLKPQSGGDNLYRVQVGPYNQLAEAQQMRERLLADGYNAVIK